MNTYIAWGVLYTVLALGMMFFAVDECSWKWRLPLSLFWPLTIAGTVVLLVCEVACICFAYIRNSWRKRIKL